MVAEGEVRILQICVIACLCFFLLLLLLFVVVLFVVLGLVCFLGFFFWEGRGGGELF